MLAKYLANGCVTIVLIAVAILIAAIVAAMLGAW